MKKILFVDDEPAILEGLQDSFRKHRRRWDMTFACGGEAAIEKMSESEFDVIVSDVRMPGVGGIDVLRFAMEKHPKAIRIALTGFADEESTIQLTALAQRYLTKPCAVNELDEAISRDSGLIEAFDNSVVQELAGSAGCLPSSDSIQQLLLDKLNSCDGSNRRYCHCCRTGHSLDGKNTTTCQFILLSAADFSGFCSACCYLPWG